MPNNQPALPLTAIDFCRVIDKKQRGTAGIAAQLVPLEDFEQEKLNQILQAYDEHGSTPALERQAHGFLVTYREVERNWRVLDDDERDQLNRLLMPSQDSNVSFRSSAPRPRLTAPRFRVRSPVTAVIAAVAAVIVLVLGGRAIFSSSSGGSPPAITQGHPPAAQQVQPGTTDLQNLSQNYGPWKQLTPSDTQPQTGSPALLLLEDGAYLASQRWTVASSAAGWQQDLSGNVTSVNVKGNFADISDADSNPYVVGINQPFVVSGNPGTVIRVDPTGNVLTMSMAQATAVRQPLSK